MLISESVPTFLRTQRQTQLVRWWLHYSTALETQIKASPEGGMPVEGKRNTWEDEHGNRWWTPPRIPEHADTEPSFKDFHIKWPLELHCEAIGTTGWHWQARRSLAFGFDFDAITHADGLTDEQLAEVKAAVEKLPYAWLTKSSGGQGFHVWVFLEGTGIETANHTEHAALARWLLSQMSADAGFNFANSVDVCGANMWIWHKKASAENGGYDVVKEGALFPCSRIPPNWRDHIPVVSRRQAKVEITGVEDMDLFTSLAQSHNVVQLEEQHRLHIDTMRELGFASDWVQDHGCWNTHVLGLKKLHEKLGLTGIYETISAGAHPLEANCSCFPRENGSWKVYRFPFRTSPPEAVTWEQDASGNTNCWLNRRPDFDQAAKVAGGKKNLKGDEYHFDSRAEARKAFEMLGIPTQVDAELDKRPATAGLTKDGRAYIQTSKWSKDGETRPNYSSEVKNTWTEDFKLPDDTSTDEKDRIIDYDSRLRYLQHNGGDKIGWRAWQPSNKGWGKITESSVKHILLSHGFDRLEAEQMMGNMCENHAWVLVNKPFQDEYPGGREWNVDALQWAFQPLSRDGEIHHPTWDLVLNHLGRELDAYLPTLQWARDCGIRLGGDYLRAYYAVMLRFPYRKLPWLFFFGEEDSGKSTFYEGFRLLLRGGRGVAIVNNALTNQSNFNSELENALLAVIEEQDLSSTPGVTEKIKTGVTGLTTPIQNKGKDTREIISINHYVQLANKISFCKIPAGDTRTTASHVSAIPKADQIGKDLLHDILRNEAPAFMRTLVDMVLPDTQDRLGLPVVHTRSKEAAMEISLDPVTQFLRDKTFKIPGAVVEYNEFVSQLRDSLPPEEQFSGTRAKIQKSLPYGHSIGEYEGKKCVSNLSWKADTKPSTSLILVRGKLVPNGS